MVKHLFIYINDCENDEKKTHKRRSYERTIASNFWVLRQPPIGIVTPYFRGLAPYESDEGFGSMVQHPQSKAQIKKQVVSQLPLARPLSFVCFVLILVA